MSDSSGFDFTQFVPGFDFLKTLSSGHGAASTVGGGWIAPSLDPQELDKRIQELKTVHFWLDQNTKAVSATIQALEVQRMTLATLQGMNLSFAELAESLKVAPAAAEKPEPSPAASQTVDPTQWWGALTQQFQQIASNAMQEMAKNAERNAAQSEPEPLEPGQADAKKTTRRPAAKRRTGASKS